MLIGAPCCGWYVQSPVLLSSHDLSHPAHRPLVPAGVSRRGPCGGPAAQRLRRPGRRRAGHARRRHRGRRRWHLRGQWRGGRGGRRREPARDGRRPSAAPRQVRRARSPTRPRSARARRLLRLSPRRRCPAARPPPPRRAPAGAPQAVAYPTRAGEVSGLPISAGGVLALVAAVALFVLAALGLRRLSVGSEDAPRRPQVSSP